MAESTFSLYGNHNYAGLTLSAVRRGIITLLADGGIKYPDYESRLVLQMALGIDAARYILQENRIVTDEESSCLKKILERRLRHEPLSRIESVRNFFGRDFFINPSVLDPRPETEGLVDLVLELAENSDEKKWPNSILDVGTGSGCLIISLLAELPYARGLGTDISNSALEIARMNAHHNCVHERVLFEQHRSLEGIIGQYDLLVSNPPYIPSRDLSGLENEVRNFDPLIALDGGEDGLSVYYEIGMKLSEVVPSGWAVFEVGSGQSTLVAEFLKKVLGRKMKRLIIRDDLSGKPRCVAVQTHN